MPGGAVRIVVVATLGVVVVLGAAEQVVEVEIDVLGLNSRGRELCREPPAGGSRNKSARAVSGIEQDQLLPRVDDHRREARPVLVCRQQVVAHQLIDGALSVDTRFGLVRAERIQGSLDVDNANGGVTASDIAGSAHVRTSFASVTLKGVTGGVTVENQNGSIVVGGLRGPCDNVTLRTSFAPIRIALPAGAKLLNVPGDNVCL